VYSFKNQYSRNLTCLPEDLRSQCRLYQNKLLADFTISRGITQLPEADQQAVIAAEFDFTKIDLKIMKKH
jgi:hypothetical protein